MADFYINKIEGTGEKEQCYQCGATIRAEQTHFIFSNNTNRYCSLKCVDDRIKSQKYTVSNYDEFFGKEKKMAESKIYDVIIVKLNDDKEVESIREPRIVVASSRNKAILDFAIKNPPKKNEEVWAKEAKYEGISG